jgi:hypothetical protein
MVFIIHRKKGGHTMDMNIRLETLFPELSGIKEFIDSEEEIDSVIDLVVGELPDYLKGVYTLLRLAERSMQQALIKSRTEVGCSDEQILRNVCGFCEANRKYEILRELFRLISKSEFALWGENCCERLGVRRGFLLVKPAHYKNDRPKIIDFKGALEEVLERLSKVTLRQHFCQN